MLGWAIITTGLHADVKIAPALNATPDAELVAVYSRDQGRAEAFAQKHGAKAAYSDLEALLRDPRVGAVFIASPNALHATQTLAAARAGKHVLVEKPMATTLDDAVAMVRACRKAGVKLGVGYHLRQHPGQRAAQRLIAEGVLGTVALAQGQWGFGVRGQNGPPPRTGLRQWWDDPELIGGASTMMGTGVHVIDLLRFVLGQEVTGWRR
jgi:1,5-anhydro-D-fructose reductase (1,5-anhydro-D-mannitol-forming)